MVTKPISFIQIDVGTDHIYGLTQQGDVYYRNKVPYSTTTYSSGYQGGNNNYNRKDEEKKEEAITWKKLAMYARVDLDAGEPVTVPAAMENPPVDVKPEVIETKPEEKTEDLPPLPNFLSF